MSGGWQGSDRKTRLPPDWYRIRARVLTRDRRRCQLGYTGCLGKATQVDHIQPGDNHDETNLQAVCTECHTAKSAREGAEARARIASLRRRPLEQHPGLRS